MSDLLPPVVAVLLAETGKFSSGMSGAISDMGKVETASMKLAKVGKAAFLGLAVAALAIGTESVKLASTFDQQMELIHTQAGASQAEVDQLKTKVLALAPAVGIGPEKLAEGLYHVESAGFRGAQALDITAAAAKDAAIGMGDMDTVSQALIGTMASGIGGVKGAADAAAYLNQIVGIGDMRMEKLAAAISTGILPSFRSAGLQMNDFGAALATITDNATPADEAATRLRMTVSLMSAPSHQAEKALASIGIGATQLADDMRKPNGLLVAVMDLKHHLENAGLSASQQNQVIQKAFGGGRTSGAILTLLEESDRLKDKYHELGNSASRAKNFEDSWASQQKQFTQQMHQLGAEAQVIGIKIGNFLIPKLQGTAQWLSKHIEVVKIAAVVIGGILVAAIAAWTYAVIANTYAMLANPTTWIVLGIVAAVALLSVAIYELVKHWSTVWAWIKRIAADVWHWLVSAWNATWGAIKGAGLAVWHWLVDAWHATLDAFKAAGRWIKAWVIDPIIGAFQTFLVRPFLAVVHVLEAYWRIWWAVARYVVLFAWGFISTVFDSIRNRIMSVLLPVIHLAETVWRAMWTGVTTAARWAWDTVLKPTIDGLVQTWKTAWGWVSSAAKAAWDDVIKPVVDFIVRLGLWVVRTEIHGLVVAWDWAWGVIKKAASMAWDGLKIIWGYVYRDGIHPIMVAIDALRKAWDTAWDAIKNAVSRAWGFVSGIFDKIKHALESVLGPLGKLFSDPAGAGRSLAHLLGFEKGGLVPGAPGEPMLAMVHGGEFVLSRDMIASMRSGNGPYQQVPVPVPVGAGGQTIVVESHSHLHLDGKELVTGMTPAVQQYIRRNGRSPFT